MRSISVVRTLALNSNPTRNYIVEKDEILDAVIDLLLSNTRPKLSPTVVRLAPFELSLRNFSMLPKTKPTGFLRFWDYRLLNQEI